jgi:hypothetical protein
VIPAGEGSIGVFSSLKSGGFPPIIQYYSRRKILVDEFAGKGGTKVSKWSFFQLRVEIATLCSNIM